MAACAASASRSSSATIGVALSNRSDGSTATHLRSSATRSSGIGRGQRRTVRSISMPSVIATPCVTLKSALSLGRSPAYRSSAAPSTPCSSKLFAILSSLGFSPAHSRTAALDHCRTSPSYNEPRCSDGRSPRRPWPVGFARSFAVRLASPTKSSKATSAKLQRSWSRARIGSARLARCSRSASGLAHTGVQPPKRARDDAAAPSPTTSPIFASPKSTSLSACSAWRAPPAAAATG